MAEKLGVSRQTIISIEKGKYDPSLPLAFEIAKTFQTTIEHVFIYKGKEEGNRDELFTKVLCNYGDYFSIYEWIYDINRYNDAFCTATITYPLLGMMIMSFCLSYLHPQFKEKDERMKLIRYKGMFVTFCVNGILSSFLYRLKLKNTYTICY